MRIRSSNPEKIVRIITITTLSFMICWGLVLVLAQVKPFWVDEWRVIYNLKFKTAAMLWGPLDFLQQFPRVYLQIIKALTSLFSYSYFILRLPSYLVGTFTIFFCYRLMNKIYRPDQVNRYLFVMILISCYTFTNYFVQVKQYTMDLLLSVFVLWQLMELFALNNKQAFKLSRYIRLCLSFPVVPFFSYTYPIAVAPLFIILSIHTILFFKNKHNAPGKATILLRQWLPLFLCAASVTVFYIVDVSQVLADKGMHKFWGHLIMDKGFNLQLFANNFFNLFAQVGAGDLYWYIFGTLGLLSFVYGIYVSAHNLVKNKNDQYPLLLLYSCLLLLLVMILFVVGKLPVGEPRLNAFTIPSISILIIHLLNRLKEIKITRAFATVIFLVLFLGVTGNIYTTFVASITDPEYAKKLEIYRNTENAILLAQAQNLPILITPGVAYPADTTLDLPFKTKVPGNWVLKTYPAYSVAQNIPVYAINDIAGLPGYMQQLPADMTSVLAGDGRSFQVVRR